MLLLKIFQLFEKKFVDEFAIIRDRAEVKLIHGQKAPNTVP